MTHQPQTVLIAEDDPVFRRVMGFSISRIGLTVECVADGESAFQRVCKGGIHFLITDHQMPICSGIELLEKLHADDSVVAPPTILCTAKGLELDSHAIESKYGLVAVIHKPFSPRKLSEMISQHLSQTSAANNDSPTLNLNMPNVGSQPAPGSQAVGDG